MANNSPKSGLKKMRGKTKFQIKLINRKLIGSHANVQRSTGCHAPKKWGCGWQTGAGFRGGVLDPQRSQLELTNDFSIRRQVLFDSFNSIRETWVEREVGTWGVKGR